MTVILRYTAFPLEFWFGHATKLKTKMKAGNGLGALEAYDFSAGLKCRGKIFSVGQTLRQSGLWDLEGPLIMYQR